MAKVNDVMTLAADLRNKVNQTGAADELTVDPNFEEDPMAAKVIEYTIKYHKNLLVVGPTGCGKSSLVLNVAARLKRRVEIFSCSGETTTDELIGKPWKVDRNGTSVTIPVYGAAVRAYRDGNILLYEELDFMQPDIAASQHRILEPSQKFIHVNVGEPEIIQRHANFCVIGTANTIGSGEDNFLYAGTKVLNEAFKNRINDTVNLDFLPPEKEKKILIAKTGVDASVAKQMIDVAVEARHKQRTDSIDRIASILSTRDLLEWADAVVGMGVHPREAALYAFLNRWPEADREVVKRMVENRCP